MPTTTPSYFPGEQTVLNGLINAGVGIAVPPLGLANLVSGLLGYGTVGSFATNHSSPGTVSALGGQSGRGGVDATASEASQSAAPSYTAAQLSSAGLNPAYASGTTTSTAQQAYLNAVAHMTGAGPAAKKANPVPLIAPSTSSASFYNPMSDPEIQAALNIARLSRMA